MNKPLEQTRVGIEAPGAQTLNKQSIWSIETQILQTISVRIFLDSVMRKTTQSTGVLSWVLFPAHQVTWNPIRPIKSQSRSWFSRLMQLGMCLMIWSIGINSWSGMGWTIRAYRASHLLSIASAWYSEYFLTNHSLNPKISCHWKCSMLSGPQK